jgi:hypothetical protein
MRERGCWRGAVLILALVNVALHFMKLFKDSRVECLVTAGGNIVPILQAVKAAAHNVRILPCVITVSGYSSASSGGQWAYTVER